MGIARATYYHSDKREQDQLKRDLELKDAIEKIHLELPGYGYRRVRHHLKRQGICVNSKRIMRVMRKYSLFSCVKKWIKQRGVALGKRLVFPNLIQGKRISGPNQVWSTDITYITLAKEYVYLSAILDIYTRKIVGWALSRDLSHKFCLEALEVAIRKEKPAKGIIHHSDRGVQGEFNWSSQHFNIEELRWVHQNVDGRIAQDALPCIRPGAQLQGDGSIDRNSGRRSPGDCPAKMLH